MENMENLWDRVKKSVKDGATYAAEKTEELTKLGKMKIEVLNLKYRISRAFTELGGLAYEQFKNGKPENIAKAKDIAASVATIVKLEKELDEKEAAFDQMKKDAAKETGEEEVK